MVLSIVIIFLIQATIATFLGLPLATKAWYSRLNFGLDCIVDIIAIKSTVLILARPTRILLFPR